MDDLLTCSVCCEGYQDGERPPVLLPRCGHSFCRPCIALIQSGGCVICPTCRADQRIESANKLPTEYSLLAIIAAQKNAKEEVCERHNVKLSFWCRTCSIATCGECLFEDHPTHSHDVIRAVQYIKDMKHLAHDIAFKFMDALDKREQNFYRNIFNCSRKINNAIRNVGILRKDMDEARNLMRGIKEQESINTATSIAEAAKFLGLKWNIQDVNFTKITKEENAEEEKERESPKRKDPEEKTSKITNKSEKKEKTVTRSKTIAGLPDINNKEVSEEDNKNTVSQDNKDAEHKENKNISNEEEVLNGESKPDELKLAEDELQELIKMKPRGRLARKALAARKAELETLAAAKEEAENNKRNENKNNQTTEDTQFNATLDNEETEKTDNAAEAKKESDQPTNNDNSEETSNEQAESTEDQSVTTKAEVPVVDGKTLELLQLPGLHVCVEGADGKLGHIEWGQYGIHVYCLQFQQLPYDVLIKSSVLSSLIPSKAPVVFLELSADDTVIGRVYIKLFGHLRRAHNFLTLCLGDFGYSYRSTKFLQVYNQGEPGERLLGGDYEYNNGRGGQGVIDDLEWNGDYAQPMKAGMITAAGSGQAATNSLFLLCSEGDDTRNFSCPFGIVTTGLQYVKEAINTHSSKKIWISECGCLLLPP